MTLLLRSLLAFTGLALVAHAESSLPPIPVPLDSSPMGFQPLSANWQIAGSLGGDPRHEKNLVGLKPGSALLVNNPTADARGQLVTAWEHGDLELDLDFLVPPGSNSGVYLMGRYEVQILDSWGVADPKFSDCGGIYQRWDETRGAGHEGYEGHAPAANASRAPGLWQHLHIEFQAPRFDAAGKKISNARFARVLLNDFLVQQDVEVTGPTRAAAFADEKPLGPLVIQGDHGPVAVRHMTYKRFDPSRSVGVGALTYKIYPGEFSRIGEYDSAKPKSAGTPPAFAGDAIDKGGKFALVFTGTFAVPADGYYEFTPLTDGPVRLQVDGRPAIIPLDSGGRSAPIMLKAGPQGFRLDYIHGGWQSPSFNLMVEGPELARVALTAPSERKADAVPPPLIIEAGDRIRLQRSFVPYDPRKRLYAINVGTPGHLNYAYDFETAALLRVWRGSFLDTAEMWVDRGEPQIAKPAGPAITLNAKPAIVLLERSAYDWPVAPETLWSSQGYTLEPDGQPVFHSKLASLTMSDRIAPTADGHGLMRTIKLSGHNTDWETWVLLAESKVITPQPDGHGYIVGDRAYYIDLPADSAVHPFVRTRNGRQQLVVPVSGSTLENPIVYTLVW
jgi:Domain of Unknown Function (DUF1080)